MLYIVTGAAVLFACFCVYRVNRLAEQLADSNARQLAMKILHSKFKEWDLPSEAGFLLSLRSHMDKDGRRMLNEHVSQLLYLSSAFLDKEVSKN